MLKILAILGAVILGITIYVASQNQRAAEQNPNQSTQQSNSFVALGGSDKHPKNNTNKPNRNPPGWYRFFTWPDSMTAWAILLTLWAVVGQTNETKRSAQAALLNAQAVINAERPWVLISVKSPPGPMGGFTVHARNRGRTPAMITEACMGCAAVKNISELPLAQGNRI